MLTIMDMINSKKNKVCSECNETNFRIDVSIIYEEDDEPYISYGIKNIVWCEFCNDEVTLIEKPLPLYQGECRFCDCKNDGDWDNRYEDNVCIKCHKLWKYNEDTDEYDKID